jgi:hypothetical protein
MSSAHTPQPMMSKDPWGRTRYRTEYPMGNGRILRLETSKGAPGIGNGWLRSDASELRVFANGDEMYSSGSYSVTLIQSQVRATPKAIREQHEAATALLATKRPDLFR